MEIYVWVWHVNVVYKELHGIITSSQLMQNGIENRWAYNYNIMYKFVAWFQLRDIRHENVNAVIGFYDDVQSPAIISDFCPRGSLEVR